MWGVPEMAVGRGAACVVRSCRMPHAVTMRATHKETA